MKNKLKIIRLKYHITNFFNSLKEKDTLPSKNTLENWFVHFSDKKYPKHKNGGGKWLIFCNEHNVDKTWNLIKISQDSGLLGNISKVSTKKNSSKNNNSFVICIYTYDSNDKTDVLRVREGLTKIGFTNPLKYKRDIETKKGIYGSKNEFLLTI